MNIYLCHPSRGRPDMAADCIKDWKSKAQAPDKIRHFLSLDADDPTRSLYPEADKTLINENAGMVQAINRLLPLCEDESGLLVTLYDDFSPPERWDRWLAGLIKAKGAGVVFVDCCNHQLQTIQIGSVSVFKRWGYVLHPEYKSMFSDNDFTEPATTDESTTVIDARFALLFDHSHPVITGRDEDMDETYRRTNAQDRYDQGAAILEKRRANNFAA